MRLKKRLIISFIRIGKCFYKAMVNTINHDGIEHSGYMAFLGMLCIFPFLVFLFALTGFLGASEAGTEFVKIFLRNLPPDVSAALKPRIQEIISGPPQGLLTIAILGTIWTASSAVEGLRTILNRAYHVYTPPTYIRRRLMSILQFLLITIALIVAMFLLIIAPVILDRFGHLLFIDYNILKPFWTYIRYILSSLILFIVVASLFFMLPNIKQNLILVVPGSIVVVILWSVVALSFSEFISSYKQINTIYGSLAGIILVLLFFYINSIVFIYGAELNYLLQSTKGRKFRVKISNSTRMK